MNIAIGGSEEWQEVFTTENLQTAGAIVGAAGWGFYSGWTQRPYSLMDQIAFEMMPQHARIACTVGWAAGFFAKIAREMSRDPNERRRKD